MSKVRIETDLAVLAYRYLEMKGKEFNWSDFYGAYRKIEKFSNQTNQHDKNPRISFKDGYIEFDEKIIKRRF